MKIGAKIVGDSTSSVYFIIGAETPLQKLMGAYCQASYLAPIWASFYYNGALLRGSDTAESVGVKDGEFLAVVIQS